MGYIDEKVFSLLRERKLTQRKLAQFLELPESVVVRWHKGESSCYKYVYQISRFFDVTPEYLLGETVPEKKERTPEEKARELYPDDEDRAFICLNIAQIPDEIVWAIKQIVKTLADKE